MNPFSVSIENAHRTQYEKALFVVIRNLNRSKSFVLPCGVVYLTFDCESVDISNVIWIPPLAVIFGITFVWWINVLLDEILQNTHMRAWDMWTKHKRNTILCKCSSWIRYWNFVLPFYHTMPEREVLYYSTSTTKPIRYKIRTEIWNFYRVVRDQKKLSQKSRLYLKKRNKNWPNPSKEPFLKLSANGKNLWSIDSKSEVCGGNVTVYCK